MVYFLRNLHTLSLTEVSHEKSVRVKVTSNVSWTWLHFALSTPFYRGREILVCPHTVMVISKFLSILLEALCLKIKLMNVSSSEVLYKCNHIFISYFQDIKLLVSSFIIRTTTFSKVFYSVSETLLKRNVCH